MDITTQSRRFGYTQRNNNNNNDDNNTLCRNLFIILTVHRREGVCFAVNIHGIAKERKVIDWGRRFASVVQL